MSVKFLDQTGVAYLWSKIKAALAGKAAVVTLASGTDADTLKTSGLYFLPDSGVNLPNNAVNGYILVISNTAGSRAKQLFMRHGTQGTNDFQTYVRQYNGTQWGDWVKILTAGQAVQISEGGTDATTAAEACANLGLAYKAGDTFTTTVNSVLAAVLTGSAKSIYVTIPMPKSLASISSITVTSFKGGARQPGGGYVGSGNASSPWSSADSFQWVGASGLTFTAEKAADNLIRIVITSSTAFTAGNTTTALANNMPINFMGTWTLSFA